MLGACYMCFFSKLFSQFKKGMGAPGYTTKAGTNAINIYVQCDKCGEKIPVRLSTTSEVQRRDGLDQDQGPGMFFIQKTIVGNRCYQRIEAAIEFDGRFNVIDSEVKNGRLLTVEEYKARD